jgi:hypothetical protein
MNEFQKSVNIEGMRNCEQSVENEVMTGNVCARMWDIDKLWKEWRKLLTDSKHTIVCVVKRNCEKSIQNEVMTHTGHAIMCETLRNFEESAEIEVLTGKYYIVWGKEKLNTLWDVWYWQTLNSL